MNIKNQIIIAIFFLFFPIFLFSGGKELTRAKAKELIIKKYHLPFQTKIAIAQNYENYGWPPEKYKQLSDLGLIVLHEASSGIYYKTFSIQMREKAKEYWLQNASIYSDQGDVMLIVFKGYLIEIKGVSVSSNAKENKAEAEINLGISNISPIQQIFAPLESTEIIKSINFKLYDNGWKIVDDENSARLFQPISVPQHWAENLKIVFNNIPADVISDDQIHNIEQVAAGSNTPQVPERILYPSRELVRITTKSGVSYKVYSVGESVSKFYVSKQITDTSYITIEKDIVLKIEKVNK